jgi:hypothetical protein
MNDFDLEEFARMFDAALASDNPSVKKALRNFMMVAAIVHAEDGNKHIAGPLETLIKKVNHLEDKIRDLQTERKYREYKENYYKDYCRDPIWTYKPNTSNTSSPKTWSYDHVSTSAIDDAMIKQLVKDLKFDDK